MVASERSQQLYAANEHSDYFYFHGLTVEFAEALAEYWHLLPQTFDLPFSSQVRSMWLVSLCKGYNGGDLLILNYLKPIQIKA